ncbi:thiamine pyrophosphate-binding protein [Chloroflexota bacterium]
MSGAQALVESLDREKVEVMFGIPGVQVMEFVDTVFRMKKVRWISVRHEQATAYMAFGYSRTTGKTGVAMVVPGPGALNASAAVGTAYAASTPLLLIAGQVDRGSLGKNRGALHEMLEQLDVFRSITKWCHRVMEVKEIPSVINKAMHITGNGRPRPVEIEIPFDLWKEKAEIEFTEREKEAELIIDTIQLKQAAGLLGEARHPTIWAGGGTITSDASEDLTTLAERINAPVVMTPEGKGAISAAHPLAAGVASFVTNPILQETDVLLCLGSRFNIPAPARAKASADLKIIQVDIDSEELGRNYPPEIGILADISTVIPGLLEELSQATNSQWTSAAINDIKARVHAKQKEVAPVQMDILQGIREVLPEDAILIPGVTNLGYWAQTFYPVLKPRTFMTNSYFGTLGYAFPTALGAKIGNPDKPVVVLCGDGGFLFSSGELATAVQYGINVIVLVFVDGAYGACLSFQRKDYENRAAGTLLENPDFTAMANSFGAKGVKLSHHNELKDALQSALSETGPVVIEVPLSDIPFPWEVSTAL